MLNKLKFLKENVLKDLKGIKSFPELEKLKTKYLGRKGELTKILRELKDLSIEEKKTVGAFANEVKAGLVNLFDTAQAKFNSDDRSNSSKKGAQVDVTLPKIQFPKGTLHPLYQVQYELEDLFTSMGFMVLDGPLLESDYYVFEALNFDATHPARDMYDTIFAKDGNLMRPHTSPVQVRALEVYGAPIKAIIPGRCFRFEKVDASHDHTFYQIEGLMVDKNLSISNLVAVMTSLFERILKKKIKTRLRPGYFPFVEPGFELDCSCIFCGQKGCPVCKHSGWIELLPCGMVHPNVLKYGGVNPEEYSGFAFGLGLDRLVMLKYGIPDIRLLKSADLRFLRQF